MRAAATVGLLIAAAALPTAQQKPGPYAEHVEVSRVLIDVRVLDSARRPITDLAAEDFAVKIGGRTARVESLQWISGTGEDVWLGDPDAPDGDPVSTPDAGRQYPGRLIVFVFQKSLERSRIVGFMRMLIEARGLLDSLEPADRVAVLSFDSSLHVWIDFTNDFDRIRRIFERGILFERPAAVQESVGPSLVRQLDPRRAKRTYSIEGALHRIGEALEYVPGAKSVVLVGHGFGRLGPNGVSMENQYGAMRDALQRARASVFSLDVTEADYHSLEAGLQLVAADTGGFFARTHIFTDHAIDSLLAALAGHYVLFVERPPLKRGTHAIEVELKQRGGRVLANRTYVVTARDETSEARPAVPPPPAGSRASRPCTATTPPESRFVPPAPYPSRAPFDDTFWYGTSSLWTMLPVNGRWKSLPRGDHGFRQKMFVWRPGYDREPGPEDFPR